LASEAGAKAKRVRSVAAASIISSIGMGKLPVDVYQV